MALEHAAARTFSRLVAFATCGAKPRKRKIGRDTAEPLLAKVLMNPAARTPMKSNRCWVIPPPALSARRRPSGACLLDGSAFGTGEFRDGTSNEAVLCGSAFLKVNK